METDFSIVFTTFLLLMGETEARKQKHHSVKFSVVLSVLLPECSDGEFSVVLSILLPECSDGDAEGFCFQVLFCIPQTVTGIFADILILLENRKMPQWGCQKRNHSDKNLYRRGEREAENL